MDSTFLLDEDVAMIHQWTSRSWTAWTSCILEKRSSPEVDFSLSKLKGEWVQKNAQHHWGCHGSRMFFNICNDLHLLTCKCHLFKIMPG